ncbi:MAG: HpcH/HpaI aldolase/citrate lyase family protein [Actinomycetes bacterium]
MATRPRRSCLAVPASSERMLAKAAELDADEIVVDLEDGVASADKERARANLPLARARGTLAVRVNKGSVADIEAASAVADVLVVPKVESPADVAAVAAHTRLPLEVQIETARGLVHVEAIAQAQQVEALVFGPGDFAASLGVPVLTIGSGASEYAMARIAVAARAFGLQAVDGPHAALGDTSALRASAERALALGYDGKWAIHPEQLETLHDVFTPTPGELERARRIVDAGDGAVRLDGEMVDEATKKLARGVIARAGG